MALASGGAGKWRISQIFSRCTEQDLCLIGCGHEEEPGVKGDHEVSAVNNDLSDSVH